MPKIPKVPRAPRESPFPKLGKERRKSLSKALRVRLSVGQHGMGDLAEALDVDPEVVVVALRELRARKRGALRTTIQMGQTVWWWEEAEKAAKMDKTKKGK